MRGREPLVESGFEQLAGQVLRSWMVDNDSAEILEYANDLGVGREEVTEIALQQSLCPIHFIDYAICFDDMPEDCDQVREIHNVFDT